MAIAEYPSSSMPEPLPPILMFFISNVHHLIPIKLDLHNYTIWKIQCEGALKASSLFQHLQESESPFPTITDHAGTSIPNPLYPKWVIADSFIRSCLISTLTPEILFQAKDFHTVPDLWKFLEQKFTSKSFATRLDYQMAKIISKRRSKTILGAGIARKRRKCSPKLTSSGLMLTPSKISSGDHLSGVTTTYQDTFKTAKSFNTTTKATWSPSNQWNATSHLPPGLISNKGLFGASPNKECWGTAGGLSVSSTDTVFGNGPVSPGVQREIDKERMRSEISCEEQENRQLVDKEVTAEVMSEKENGFHRAEGSQGFAGFSSSTTGPTILNEPTPPQSTGAQSPPIFVEPFRSATSFNATTNASWSPNQWNSTSHLPFNLNSNNEFGASPNEECRIGFHRAEGFQELAGPSPFTTGQAILNKPKLEVADQANSRFLNDRAALSSEERMGYQAPQGNGNFQRLPYHGFQGSCGPHVSQNWNASISSELGAAIAEPAILNEPNLMVGDQANSRFLKGTVALPLEEKKGYQTPKASGSLQRLPFQGFQGSFGPQISQAKLDANTNLSGSKRKTLSPPPSGTSYLSLFVSRKNKKHWNCALCQTSFTDLQLENHLRSKRHVEASKLSTDNSHLTFDLNSNKLFGASPDKESRRHSSIADGSGVSSAITGFSVGPVTHGVLCEIQKEIIGNNISSEETGCEHGHLVDKEVRSGKEMDFQGLACFSASTTEPTTILNEPKLVVGDHGNSRFLKDTVVTSLEEEKKGKASGSLQRLPFQGFQGSSGPQISQCKSATIRFGSKPETVSPQTEARLRAELSTGKTPVEVVAGIADPKIPSSLKEELDGQVQHVKEQLNGDLCLIGTDTENVDG